MLPYNIHYRKKRLKAEAQLRCDKWIFDTTLYFNKKEEPLSQSNKDKTWLLRHYKKSESLQDINFYTLRDVLYVKSKENRLFYFSLIFFFF